MRELVLLVDAQAAEALADALLAAGALSATLEDADADSPDEQALYGEPGLTPTRHAWQRSLLTALFAAGTDAHALLARCAQQLAIAPPAVQAERLVHDQDWVRSTQAQFPPVHISDRLWIVPSWHDAPDPAALALRLDPGAAFGTGTHPTTRLCLRWLDAHAPRAARVLDYGCGSGILAIAAAMLGAGPVVATDIDPQALAAARCNAAANAVSVHYTDPGHLPAGAFDLVLANILSNPLRVLAPALLARVAAGGTLVLSGILERQADELIAVYRAHDAAVALAVWGVDEGWVCLAGTRA